MFDSNKRLFALWDAASPHPLRDHLHRTDQNDQLAKERHRSLLRNEKELSHWNRPRHQTVKAGHPGVEIPKEISLVQWQSNKTIANIQRPQLRLLQRLQIPPQRRYLLTVQTHYQLMVIQRLQERVPLVPKIRHLPYNVIHPTGNHDRLLRPEKSPALGSPIRPQHPHLPRHRPLHHLHSQSLLFNRVPNQSRNANLPR